jgi:hypothetical protein
MRRTIIDIDNGQDQFSNSLETMEIIGKPQENKQKADLKKRKKKS